MANPILRAPESRPVETGTAPGHEATIAQRVPNPLPSELPRQYVYVRQARQRVGDHVRVRFWPFLADCWTQDDHRQAPRGGSEYVPHEFVYVTRLDLMRERAAPNTVSGSAGVVLDQGPNEARAP
jgi:hypothetical protein